MKKLMVVLLACVLLAAMLLACGCDETFPGLGDIIGGIGDNGDGNSDGGGDNGNTGEGGGDLADEGGHGGIPGGNGDQSHGGVSGDPNGSGGFGGGATGGGQGGGQGNVPGGSGDMGGNGGFGGGDTSDRDHGGRPGGNGDQSHGGGASGDPNGNGGGSGEPSGGNGGNGGGSSGGMFEYETYTVTFVADEETVGTLEFSTRDIEEEYYAFILAGKDIETLLEEYDLAELVKVSIPEVPVKQCCDGKWGDYALEEKNITVYAVYEEHHTLSKFEAKEPKCNEKGNIEYYACSECGRYFTDAEGKTEINDKQSVILGEVDHSYAYCVCIWCGNAQHTLVHYERVEAKCNEKGNIEYYACSECGKYFSDAEGKTEINDKESVILGEVDHSYAYCICIWCGNTQHTPEHYERVEAKCNEKGNIEYYACSECERYFLDAEGETEINDKESVILGEVDHSYADCVCIWCGNVQHTLVHYERVEAKCNEKGNIEYYACSECGRYFSDAEGENEIIDRGSVVLNEVGCSYVKGYCEWCGKRKISKGLEYRLSDDESYYIVASIGSCTDTEVGIPDEYNGKPVKAIGMYAFRRCNSLTLVTMPNIITMIGECAFENCKSLTSIIIPDDVTNIGDRAFYYCSGLTSVTIGKGVTNIGKYAFQNCSGLEEIIFNAKAMNDPWGDNDASPANNPVVFGGAGRNGNGITVRIGEEVTRIPANLFRSSGTKITTIEFEEGSVCESIGEKAFGWCGDSVTSITIPESVTRIEYSAFSGCSKALESITVAEGNSKYHLAGKCLIETESKTLVLGCKDSVIPSDGSVTRIGDGAFYYCTFTTVTIPNTITSIGVSAFTYCDNLTNVTIPDSVTSIEKGAFSSCRDLTSITIPNSVISIGENAFHSCSSLRSIMIPDVVTSIGDSTFYGCNSLASVTIGKGITSIGKNAFRGCSSLKSITIPDSVTSIGSGTFSGCSSLISITLPFVGSSVSAISADSSTLFGYIFGTSSYKGGRYTKQYYSSDLYSDYYIPQSLKNVTITGGSIHYGAFCNCDDLTNVNIGNGVTSIGSRAFRDCGSLTSVTIGKSVTSIGDYAFYNCSSLTSVTIGKSVTSIGSSAFSGCSSLESITLPFVGGSVSAISADSSTLFGYIFGTSSYIGGRYTKQYYSSDLYSEYYIPQSLKSVTITSGNILYGAFCNCDDLMNVNIANGVTSIGSRAFRDCGSLTSVTIGNSVTSIGDYAFSSCRSLTRVNISDIAAWCAISFGNPSSNPLSYVKNLYLNGSLVTELVIPEGVTSIGACAFYNCSGLTSVTIPNSVTNIGAWAFRDCGSLTSVTIPNSVTSIGGSAFLGCSSLTSISIPNSVTRIGAGAFSYCSSLTSITIPDSVTSIESYAFSNCSSLENITVAEGNSKYHSAGNCIIETESKTLIIGCKNSVIPDDGSVTSIGSYAFSGCSSLTSITIPDSVTSIGDYAFYYCSSLTSITIPDSVTSIGNCAFYDCSSLTTINYTGSEEEWNAMSKGINWDKYTGNYTVNYDYKGE